MSNPDHVICPNCCHSFRAIPENVQRENASLREQLRVAIDALKDAYHIDASKAAFEALETIANLRADKKKLEADLAMKTTLLAKTIEQVKQVDADLVNSEKIRHAEKRNSH